MISRGITSVALSLAALIPAALIPGSFGCSTSQRTSQNVRPSASPAEAAPADSGALPGVSAAQPAGSPATAATGVAAKATGGARFEPDIVTDVQGAMGTEVSLVAITSREKGVTDVELAFEQAWKEVERLEGLLTSWTAESDVGRVNQGSAQWVSVASETAFVVERSLLSSRLSQGAFDISFHTLGELWRFGDAQELNPRVPTPSQVAQARKLIDYRKVEVELQPPRVRIGREMRIDLGGIAKGYIVDQIVKVLRDRGLGSFLVQAGGDLYGAGRKPDGSAWVSGVRDPRGPRDRSFAVIDLTDHAFSTAGDYARAYVLNGKRYHHIIDPRTGYPATESRSVTIWAPDALTADAIDDAVFILGPVAGLKLVESLPGVGALIVDKNNKVWVSERLQGKIKMVAEPTPGL